MSFDLYDIEDLERNVVNLNKPVPLKIEELKQGQVYTCRISGRKILIISEKKDKGYYFHENFGFQMCPIYDNQLI